MKEYKAKYSREKAKQILADIGAVFIGKTEQEDFYLKTKNGNIFKIQKEDGDMYLVNLELENDGFVLNFSEFLSEEVKEDLRPVFQNRGLVLEKAREHYTWKGSKISLDKVEKFGEFIEFFPVDDKAKEELLGIFGIQPADLIVKSYFDL